jgi:hypothetical protein
MGFGDWAQRYRAGDREGVWAELRQLGADVRDTEIQAVAQAVCDEMALRARFNVQLLVRRLRAEGFAFHSNDDQRTPVNPFRPAGPDAPRLLAWLEGELGPVPLVLSSWLRLVGDVWLVGTHPAWPELSGADPLVIELEGSRYPDTEITEYFANEHEAWEEEAAHDSTAGSFLLPVSPDRLHKANLSGGQPYGFQIPCSDADGIFATPAEMSFVSYLNFIFENGGFAAWPPGDAMEQLKNRLADGMLAL